MQTLSRFRISIVTATLRRADGANRPALRLRKAAWAVATLAAGVLALASPVPADDLGPPRQLGDAASFLRKAAAGKDAADIKSRARHAAWSLIVGELAADPERAMLFTTGVDALGDGLKELEQVETELKNDPSQEQAISKDPSLAMQLDGVRVRRARSEGKLELSRKEERERLAQLRELVNAYREVANALAVANAHMLMGNMESTRSANETAARNLAALEAVVARRRDYYLFSDEPGLDAAGTSELKFVTSAPQPFANDLKPHMAALQALAIYRIAVGGPAPPEAKVLDAAQALAEGAAGDGPGKNAVALYVLGHVHRQRGLLLTAADPLGAEAHAAAAPHFKAARESFETLRALKAERPGALSGVVAEVDQHGEELASADVFLAEAARLTSLGRLVQADTTLRRGLLYHRSAPLLIARAETARRGELDLDEAVRELDRAGAEGLLPPADPRGQLVRAKLVLARAWRTATVALEKMGVPERAALETEVAAQPGALEAAAGADPALGPQLKAYGSFAVAIRSMINPSADPEGQEAGLRQAAGAASTLAAQLGQAQGAPDAIAVREALVACRLAQGFLAVRVLPSYRDDATNAFAAAADEQAKLPFQGSALKVLGSPLVTAMLSRPEGQSIRLAQEERQLRQVVSRFLEGAFSQALGSSTGAASQMAGALDEVRGLADSLPAESVPLDAARMLDRSETADARKATLRQIRSFSVLSFIKAGEVRRGLVEAVRTVAGDRLPASSEDAAFQAITPELLERAIHASASPLEAFSLGTALEAQALSPQPLRAPSEWLATALRAQTQAKRLFDGSKAARDRFPELVNLNSQAIGRLTSPQDDIADARRLRTAGQIHEAVVRLRVAAVRHPKSSPVRAELALCVCDQVDLGQAGNAALQRELTALEPYRATADPGLQLVIADIEERLGQTAQALESYRSVVARSRSAEERIKAGTRIAVLAGQHAQ